MDCQLIGLPFQIRQLTEESRSYSSRCVTLTRTIINFNLLYSVIKVIFFNPKIHDYLLSLAKPSPSKVLKYIDLLETFGHRLGMPYSKQIAHNLYELRIRGNQEIRILYCFHQNHATIVHAFIKKSQKTPRKEIDTALKRIALLTET